MNNSLTSIFIENFAVHTSKLATEQDEIRIAIWMASRDQSVLGLGCVGFDIQDIPWTAEGFEREKKFLLNVSTEMKKDRLSRDVLNCVETFEHMIGSLEIKNNNCKEQKDPAAVIEKCAKHGIYLHRYGCVICNNEG